MRRSSFLRVLRENWFEGKEIHLKNGKAGFDLK